MVGFNGGVEQATYHISRGKLLFGAWRLIGLQEGKGQLSFLIGLLKEEASDLQNCDRARTGKQNHGG